MPYSLDYGDQVRFGIQEPDEPYVGTDVCDTCGKTAEGTDVDGDTVDRFLCWACLEEEARRDCPVQECPHCGAWGSDANDPHEPTCPLYREPDTDLPF